MLQERAKRRKEKLKAEQKAKSKRDDDRRKGGTSAMPKDLLQLKRKALLHLDEDVDDRELLDMFKKVAAARRRKLWNRRLWLLFREYRPELYFFEVVDLLFQFVCYSCVPIIAAIVGAGDAALQVQAALCFCYFVVHLYVRPYADAHFNIAKQASLLCLFGLYEAGFVNHATNFLANILTPAFSNSELAGFQPLSSASWNASSALFDVHSGTATRTDIESVPEYYQSLATLVEIQSPTLALLFMDAYCWLLLFAGVLCTAGSVVVLGSILARLALTTDAKQEGILRMWQQSTPSPIELTFTEKDTVTKPDNSDSARLRLERDWNHLSRLKNIALDCLNDAIVDELKALRQFTEDAIEEHGEGVRTAASLNQEVRARG